MACNRILGEGKDSMIGPPDMNKTFTLSQAEIAVFDREVYDLIIDVETLHDMAKVGGSIYMYLYNYRYHTVYELIIEILHDMAKVGALGTYKLQVP